MISVSHEREVDVLGSVTPSRRWERWFRAAAALVFALAVTGAVALVTAGRSPSVDPLPWMGNRPEVVARLPRAEPTAAFRFLVAGDPEDGPGHLVGLLRRFRDRPPDFVILTGDVVKYPTEDRFAHFLARMREVGWEVPTFVAVGNCDVPDVSNGVFESVIGPRVFQFEYAGCLFAFFDDAHGTVGEGQLRPLRDLLSRDRARFRRVFFVLHRPPVEVKTLSPERQETKEATHAALLALARRYRVDYVLCGHLHGYARIEHDGTTFLVTGGAGGELQQEAAGYHLVEMSVSASGDIREDVVTTGIERQPFQESLTDWEVKVLPWVRAHPWVSLTIEAALALFGVALVVAARTRARRMPA